MNRALKRDLEESQAMAQKVVRDAGLTVLHGEEPTAYQVAIATLHGREDAAMLVALQLKTMQRLDRHVWYLRAIVALLLVLLATSGHSASRSAAARAEFQRATPCPATGLRRGACPGWVVDHRMPLCAGGEDHPGNLQWQTVADAVEKDRHERRLCRALKKALWLDGEAAS